MVLHIKIRDFGRIESADISLNNLVVFVGNNNSGKTMVMQLIYGIRKELGKFSVPVSGAKQSELNGQYLIRCDQDWFREVELQINKYLSENKSRIIEDIFGTPISVGEIQIELEGVEFTYFVSSVSEYQYINAGEQQAGISIDTRQYENGDNIKSFASRIFDCDYSDAVVKETIQIVWRIILFGKNVLDSGQLFYRHRVQDYSCCINITLPQKQREI